jgi:tRNA(fMet)-specific endonuclease VapC
MSFYILDTDCLSLLQRRHPTLVANVSSVPPDEVAVTIISVEEQPPGWYAQIRRARKPPQLARAYQQLTDNVVMLSRLAVLTFTLPAIARFNQLTGLQLNISTMDLRIAAITLENSGPLVTRNARDCQRVPNLTIVDWTV